MYQRLSSYRQKQVTIEPVRLMVMEVRRYLPRLGTRKLYHVLKPKFDAQGIKLGRDGFFDYLRDQKLLIKPVRSYTKTTHSKHWMRKHPNRYSDLELKRPEQAFVSDITYVKSDAGVHYLSLVTDAYSRKIMGYELSHGLSAQETAGALVKAIKQRQTRRKLIHHSDRGLQYCSELYQQILRKNEITPSMTDGYDCYQNALAERVNGILKQEFLFNRCQTFEELKQLVKESVEIYNQRRPHLSLGMKTPNEVHEKARRETRRA